MKKVHYRVFEPDCRYQGQSEFDYQHQTICGYVRDIVTVYPIEVTCKFCLKLMCPDP